MLKQLRIKFVCITMLVFTLMLCIICGLIINSTSRRLEMQSFQIMQELTISPLRGNRPNEPPVHEFEARIPFFSVRLDQNGTITETHSDYYDLSDEDFLREITTLVSAADKPVGVLSDYSLRYSRSTHPNGQVLVFMDTSSEELMMNSLWRNCLLIGLAAWLAFFGVSLLLARWAIRPVEQAWKQQKQFVSDASHELKTPLTVILTNAELLQDAAYSEMEQLQFSRNILTMAHQMRDLTENLLDLARADNGRIQTSFGPVDLSRLVSDALLPFEPLCFEHGLTLESHVEEGIRLQGSERHLCQVVDILLDNAAKYSPSPAVIDLRLERRGNHALFTLSNPCEEISKEELQNIFKRFYRLDKARTERHSYGLGLSIAEAIITEHHGHIRADWKDGRIRFSVQLPM